MNNEHFENLINHEERFIELSDAFDVIYDELNSNSEITTKHRRKLASCLINLYIILVTPHEIDD